jgi:hypothetical protein
MSTLADLTAKTAAANGPLDDEFGAEVARIRASGTLGRSTQLLRLFDFLVDCQARGRIPKEVEVAIDGFGRDADFDAGQDALVRVHAHKLRRRLEDYYRSDAPQAAHRISIPRGEYRLVLESAADPVLAIKPRWSPLSAREKIAAVICALLAATCIALWIHGKRPLADAQISAVRSSALWAPLLQDSLPIQLVLGDYYIFGERDARKGIRRLIRDFDVNSRQDLEQRFVDDPTLVSRYVDLNLGYLPTSSAAALRAVLPVVMSSGKRVSLTLASELDPSTTKTTHIVYIGYLSALGMLQDIVFAGSRFSFGGSFDELVDHSTGVAYVSEAGEPHAPSDRYRDYGYVATFAGPAGNQHLIIAGERDTALMQAAENVADPQQLALLAQDQKKTAAYEVLYEVSGVNGTNVESRLVDVTALDADAIWRE